MTCSSQKVNLERIVTGFQAAVPLSGALSERVGKGEIVIQVETIIFPFPAFKPSENTVTFLKKLPN